MSEEETVPCPVCKKRVLDIEADFAVLYIKCPHCRKKSRIVWTKKSIDKFNKQTYRARVP